MISKRALDVTRAPFLASSATILLAVAPAHTATLLVPAAYPKVQEAVLAANPGDTVLVAPGSYTELIRMREGVVLRSAAGPDSTTLVSAGLGATPMQERLIECLEGIGRTTVIEGFTFDAAGLGGAAIYCEKGSPTIRGNRIRGFGWGLNLRSSEALVEDNLIEECRSFGISVFASSPLIRRNEIRSNAPEGIVISGKESRPVIGGSRENTNKIYGNPIGIANQSRNDIDATWNDWGWEIAAEMSSKGYPSDITVILDGNDRLRSHRGKGTVDYRHWIGESAKTSSSGRAVPLIAISIAAFGLLALLVVLARRRTPKSVSASA